MKTSIHAPLVLTILGALCAPAQAELTPAGQEVSATIDRFCDSLRTANIILSGIKDRNTADAAVPTLRQHLRAMFFGMQAIKQLEVKNTTNDEDYILLMRQVLDLQLLQGDFERYCLCLAEQNFYGSEKLARLFQAMAELYRHENQEESDLQKPAEFPSEDDERLRKRRERHQERVKFYQNQ